MPCSPSNSAPCYVSSSRALQVILVAAGGLAVAQVQHVETPSTTQNAVQLAALRLGRDPVLSKSEAELLAKVTQPGRKQAADIDEGHSSWSTIFFVAVFSASAWACRNRFPRVLSSLQNQLQPDGGAPGGRYAPVSSSEQDTLLTVDAPADDAAGPPRFRGSTEEEEDATDLSSMPLMASAMSMFHRFTGISMETRFRMPGDEEDPYNYDEVWLDENGRDEERQGLLKHSEDNDSRNQSYRSVLEESDEDSMAALMKLRPSARDSVGDDTEEEVGAEGARPIVGSERAGVLARSDRSGGLSERSN
eukprot:TRINITY_DN17848_c0_g1_i1.p1 TRINITY_DN17848_c0_g1~~TRINITY_DN17848_c0_g1_i1.p1  ORF type:complete len:305 (+),score=65.70 TRINITY_DN17848_c0_g1_i1:62-976(+)